MKKQEENKEVKKETKKVSPSKYKITKSNGKVIYREKEYCGEVKRKRLKSKGWKVEEA